MTVDRTHVLATPGMDAHGSYVALSRHRDGMDLHYGRDDFASQDRLVRTLSRDRAKDMASDYERLDPAQGYAERRGITFRERVAEIVSESRAGKTARHVRWSAAARRRCAWFGWRAAAGKGKRRDRGAARNRHARKGGAEDPEAALRKVRTQGAHPSCPSCGCDLRQRRSWAVGPARSR